MSDIVPLRRRHPIVLGDDVSGLGGGVTLINFVLIGIFFNVINAF